MTHYSITDTMLKQLINELAAAVSESYLCDNPTLRRSDIEAIVDNVLFDGDDGATPEHSKITNE